MHSENIIEFKFYFQSWGAGAKQQPDSGEVITICLVYEQVQFVKREVKIQYKDGYVFLEAVKMTLKYYAHKQD